MKLIVGLGNPGKEYEKTFHNVGFIVVDAFCKEKNLGIFKENKKFKALFLEANLNQEKVLFLKPLTFMNNSGEAVKKMMDFYKINLNNLIVIHDDLDIKIGEIKIAFGRGSAGHNGVNSIINHIKSENFSRIRIGIKKENVRIPSDKYVLKKIGFFEQIKLKKGLGRANEALEEILKNGYEKAMTKFN